LFGLVAMMVKLRIDSAMDLALEADRVHHRPDVNLPRGTGSSNPVPSSGAEQRAGALRC
jgi:hypothetical protein